MSDASARHLYPPPTFNLPPAEVRLVRDFCHGKQWGVDTARYGVPYVFSRINEGATWVIAAGPFPEPGAAEAWIARLQ